MPSLKPFIGAIRARAIKARRPATAQLKLPTTVAVPPTKPSALASSSDTTLEDFPSLPSSGPIIASLNYATDTELIDAILTADPPVPVAPPRSRRAAQNLALSLSNTAKLNKELAVLPALAESASRYDLTWKSSIDPGFAFLALRTRSSFNQFITYIRPKVSQIWTALQPSGMHELFASDVLIRSGDIKAIHQIIELVGESQPRVRPSALIAMYEHIRPHLGRGVSPLSADALKEVSKALRAEGNTELIPEVYEAMINATEFWEPKQSMRFFDPLIYMLKHNLVDKSLGMLQLLIAADCLPRSAAGRTDPTHPEAKRILILSIVLRCCVEYNFTVRMKEIAEELLSLMERTRVTPYFPETLYPLARGDIAGGDPEEMQWAGDILLRFAKLHNAPPLSSAMINMYLQNNRINAATEWYLKLPAAHHPPSATQIKRMARLRPNKSVLTALLNDVLKLPASQFEPHQSEFILAMIKVHQVDAVMDLYNLWSSTLRLSPDLVMGIVKLLRKERPNDPAARKMMEDITVAYAQTAEPGIPRQLTLVRLRLLGEGQKALSLEENANLLEGIELTDEALRAYVKEVMYQDKVEGYMLDKYLTKQGLQVTITMEKLWSRCLRGKWEMLDRLKHMLIVAPTSPDTRKARKRVDNEEIKKAGKDGSEEVKALTTSDGVTESDGVTKSDGVPTEPGEDAFLSDASRSSTRRLIDVLQAARDRDAPRVEVCLGQMVINGDEVPLGLRIGLIRRCVFFGGWKSALRMYDAFSLERVDEETKSVWRQTGFWIAGQLRTALKGAGKMDTVKLLRGEEVRMVEIKMRGIEVDEPEWDEARMNQELRMREIMGERWDLLRKDAREIQDASDAKEERRRQRAAEAAREAEEVERDDPMDTMEMTFRRAIRRDAKRAEEMIDETGDGEVDVQVATAERSAAGRKRGHKDVKKHRAREVIGA